MRLLLLLTLLCSPVFALERINGWCEQGGQPVVTSNVNSTTRVQRSYPGCQVAVYVRGTATLASIFSDQSGSTPLANPFTASATNGFWGFYAQGRFDIQLSGGGLASPITLPDYHVANFISVFDFGAKCDGITDDTVALQAALDAAAGSYLPFPATQCLSGPLYISSGTTVQFANLKLKNNQTYGNLLNKSIFTANTDYNIKIYDSVLDGNGVNQAGQNQNSCIYTKNSHNMRIVNNVMKNCYVHGMRIDNNNNNVVIDGNHVETMTVGSGILVGNGGGAGKNDNVIISNNVVMDTAAANCIFVLGTLNTAVYGTNGVSITGNTVSKCTDVGIELGAHSQNYAVTGNTVYMPSASQSKYFTGIMVRSAKNGVVSGNSVYGDGTNPGNQDCYFIWGWSGGPDPVITDILTLTGNTASGCTRHGFSMNSGNRINMAGNTSYNNGVNFFINPNVGPLTNFTRGANSSDPINNLLPDTNNTTDIGSPSLYWRDLYVSRQFTSAVYVGTNPAQLGQINLSNTGAINYRNAANNGDRLMFSGNSSNQIVVGSPMNFFNGSTYNSIIDVDSVDMRTGAKIQGVSGLTNNISCAAGTAIRAINISGGIVLSASCAAP